MVIKSRDDLADWTEFRKQTLTALNGFAPDQSVHVGLDDFEFSINGRAWTGRIVLVGPKGDVSLAALKRDDLKFKSGTAMLAADGKTLQLNGIGKGLAKEANKTLDRMSLSFVLASAEADEQPARPEAPAKAPPTAPPQPDPALAAQVRDRKAALKDVLAAKLASSPDPRIVALTRGAAEAEKRGDLAGALAALDELAQELTGRRPQAAAASSGGAPPPPPGGGAGVEAQPADAADAGEAAEAAQRKAELFARARAVIAADAGLRAGVGKWVKEIDTAEREQRWADVLTLSDELGDFLDDAQPASADGLAAAAAAEAAWRSALAERIRAAIVARPELREPATALLRKGEAATAAGDQAMALAVQDQIDDLLADDGPPRDDEASAGKVDLGDWRQYRAWLRPRLRLLSRAVDAPEPVYVTRKKFDFLIDGKPWRGPLVMAGVKCTAMLQRLKREGCSFFPATGHVRETDQVIVAPELAAAAQKSGDRTLKRLRLGYTFDVGSPVVAAPRPLPPPQPTMGPTGAVPGPGPMPQAKPKVVATGPTATPISRAFRSELKPEMFNRPESMSVQELEDLCVQYNFVAKEAGTFKTTIVDKTLGLTTGRTGDYPVTNLAKDTKTFWEALFAMRHEEEHREAVEEARSNQEPEPAKTPAPPVPPLWSAQRIRQHQSGWMEGSGVDSIKAHRPSNIGTARVDLDRPQQAFVAPEALAAANTELARVGSFLRFEAVGKVGDDGLVKIRPVWNTDRAVTATHEESHSRLVKWNEDRQKQLASGQDADPQTTYVSWADCHRTAQTIMGSEEKNSGIGDTERVVMKGLDELVTPISKEKIYEIKNATDHGANRAMHGFFAVAMPKVRARLEQKAKAGGLSRAEAEVLKIIVAQGEGSDPPKNYRLAYRAIMDDPDMAKAFAVEFGTNEAIVPRVGTAFSQINDEVEKKNILDAGGDAWNFHFAGVVLVNPDGSYMTLENLSVEDPGSVNANWYFAVYDPKSGKSFHEVNKKDSHVGAHPITLLFDKVPQ